MQRRLLACGVRSVTTQTLTLTDFLLARITEDEADAEEMAAGQLVIGLNRALAECEAKRQIVKLHAPFECCNVRCKGGGLHCFACNEGGNGEIVHFPCPTVRALAAVYADHPDYLGGGERE